MGTAFFLKTASIHSPFSLRHGGAKHKEKADFQRKPAKVQKNGVLEMIRTPDRALRRRMLYPTELPGQQENINTESKKIQV